MCGGVEARDAEKSYKVYFPSPKTAIPVLGAGGEELGWVRWGRRKGEPGASPQGGWAKLETVERGGWEKYKPKRVMGLVQRYMGKGRRAHLTLVRYGWVLPHFHGRF